VVTRDERAAQRTEQADKAEARRQRLFERFGVQTGPESPAEQFLRTPLGTILLTVGAFALGVYLVIVLVHSLLS
jgi:hypothetical protein